MALPNDDFLDLWSAHEAPTYRSFCLPVCFKCQTTIEWSLAVPGPNVLLMLQVVFPAL